MRPRPLRPLLVGRAAHRAREAARAVGAGLLRRRGRPGYDLASGEAGLALVHAGLDAAFPGAGHASASERALGRAIAQIAQAPTGPSLWNGFAGVAWAVQILGAGDDDDDEQAESAIDEALAMMLAHEPWGAPFDLIEGLAGFAVYALERLPRASARRQLARIVRHLASTATRRGPGLAWQTDPAWVPAGGVIPAWNLGVAHGSPGVIAVLGRICASGADARTRASARRLLDGAVAWVLAQELPRGAGACFSFSADPGEGSKPARSAWCYGDPGVAAALMVAARCTGERSWRREAKRIALATASRDEAEAGVVDAGVCHGAAGLGHIFHRLYRATNDERLARAARVWFARTLAMADASTPLLWRDPLKSKGLLTGPGGTALALLAATGDADASWDRALLLSANESA